MKLRHIKTIMRLQRRLHLSGAGTKLFKNAITNLRRALKDDKIIGKRIRTKARIRLKRQFKNK